MLRRNCLTGPMSLRRSLPGLSALAIALLLALLAAGCGGRQDAASLSDTGLSDAGLGAGGSDAAARPGAPPAQLSQLPGIYEALESGKLQQHNQDAAPGLLPLANPAQREASSFEFELDLNSGNLRGSTVDGGGLHLDSSGGQLSAAYFIVNNSYNGRAVQFLAPYTITVNKSGAGAVWVGFADFLNQRWQFTDAPITEASRTLDVYLDRNAADFNGRFLFCVAVQSGQSADVTSITAEYPDAPPPMEPVRYLQYIEARDGVKLGTDIYLPYFYASQLEQILAPPPHPAALVRTPYDKALIDAELIGLAPQAYTVAIVQYFRGRRFDSGMLPDSDGEESLFRDHAGPDHFDTIDTVEWLEGRNFYNGRLALIGQSALGISAYQSLPELGGRCEFLFGQVSCADPFGYAMVKNGCFRQYNMESFLAANEYPAELLTAVQTAYATQDAPFFSAVDFNPRLNEAVTPGFHESGWWDCDLSETIESYRLLQDFGQSGAAGQQRLIIGPWTHNSLRTRAAGELSFPDSMDFRDPAQIPGEWDGFLQGLTVLGRNLPMAFPLSNVRYYVVGPQGSTTGRSNSWEEAAEWPPLTSSGHAWYFDPLGTLAEDPPAESGGVSFDCDPLDPVDTLGGAMLQFGPLQAGPLDQTATISHEDARLFSSGVLLTDTTLVGTVSATLNVMTSATDTDIMLRVVDIHPDAGPMMLVCNGAVRLSRYLEAQGQGPLLPNTAYEVSFDIADVGYNFEAGHQIGVIISSSDFPLFGINPGNGEAFFTGANGVVQNNTLLTGPADTPSLIFLPLSLPLM